MTARFACPLALLLALPGLAAWPTTAQAAPGDMNHLVATITTHMPNVPPQTMTVRRDLCLSTHHDGRDVFDGWNRDKKDCTVSDYKVTDKKSHFHYACTGKVPTQGDFDGTPKDLGGYHAVMTIHGEGPMAGMTTQMVLDTSPYGKTCDYTPPPVPKH